jgi:hypothetical protein
MIKKWDDLKLRDPELAYILQPGFDKLNIYENYTDLTPAYTWAMGMVLVSFYC